MVTETVRTVKTIDATAFVLIELPQRDHMAYLVCLLMSNGEERRIGISGSKRGCRQSMRNHPALRHLPEEVRGAGGALVGTIRPVESGERV